MSELKKFKVKPTGKMLMVKMDTLITKVGRIIMPGEVNIGDILRRAVIIAKGDECKLNIGDRVYCDLRANMVEVEAFTRNHLKKKEQVYLVYEDNIPALIEETEESGTDIIDALAEAEIADAMGETIEKNESAAHEAFNRLNGPFKDINSKMRKTAKIDDNQKQIVDGLRKLGLSVQSLASIGNGCPDIVVGTDRKNFLFEIKDGSKPPSKRLLTDDEVKWHERWKGQVHVVETIEDVLNVIRMAK